MRLLNKAVLASLICFMPLGAESIDNTIKTPVFNTLPSKNLMLSDLDFIRTIFQIQYAPKSWKYDHLQWDLDTHVEQARQKILTSHKITLKEYHQIIRSFFYSMQDYHVGIRFNSTEYASLPFQIKGAEGHYFVAAIDKERLFQPLYPIYEGDELISFDGRPVNDVVNEIRLQLGPGNQSTNQALAELILTFRSRLVGHEVPKGPVLLTFKQKNTGKVKSYQLIWNYSPEKITTLPIGEAELASKKKNPGYNDIPSIQDSPLFNRQFVAAIHDLKKIPGAAFFTSPQDLGSRESYIPALGTKLWEAPSGTFYHAYIYENAQGKKIGYIRIPHYSAATEETREFGQLILKMEEQTDALVIDEINNPGGSVFHMYSLASMLSQQALATPRHRMTITQNDIEMAALYLPMLEKIQNDSDAQSILGHTFASFPVTHQFALFFQNYLQFIVSEWNSGHTLTEPSHLYGIDYINPCTMCNYSKPILVIVNNLCFSCGDFFPAILQDNKAAKIFGSRTAGAGGYVLRMEYTNLLGIKGFCYTGSLAERLDKNPIENLGVTPDIEYVLTADDIQNGYQGYVQAINATISGMIE